MLPRLGFAKRCGASQFSTFQAVGTAFMQLHDFTGLPWVVLVPGGTIVLRSVLTLPLSIWQRKRFIKQQKLRKLVQAVSPVVKLRLAAAVNSKNGLAEVTGLGHRKRDDIGSNLKASELTAEQIIFLSFKEMRKRQKALFKKHDVQIWKNAVLPIIQVPLWVSISMGLRQLTEQTIKESNTITNSDYNVWNYLNSMDLSLPPDQAPLALASILGALAMVNVENNNKMVQTTNTSALNIETADSKRSKSPRAISGIINLSRLLSVLLMIISSQAPILLSLYWISSQLYSILQNTILNWLWPYHN